ncbi:MFS transporter [Actinoplanes sp. NPDC024001]|uniref:MFS transporter n=1 Tax=Actinoplanes sp. NPDC024001 TaxID=3154598 RepID=UPI0033ED28E9
MITLQRARWAVLAAFFTNGAAFATWAPRIPTVQDSLSLDATMLGLALTSGALGGLLFTLPAGAIVDRLGSRRALLTAITALCLCLPLPGLAGGWWPLAAAMLLLGAIDSLMDVAMNAHGVLLEQRSGRSMLNGFHASWSVGAVTGGVAGAAAAAAGLPVWAHLLAAGTLLGTITLLLGRGLLTHRQPRPQGGRRTRIARPTPILAVAGLLVLAAAFIEDVPQSWSAVYLSTGLGAGPGVAGLAFVAFSVFMAAGRFVGDRLTDRFGQSRVLFTGGLLITFGFAAGLAINHPAAAIAGFALVGLGASPIFPTAFSVAGRAAGTSGAAGIALVSMVSRFGFLLAPLLVGVLADATNFRYALGVVVLAGAVVTVLAARLRREMRATVAA